MCLNSHAQLTPRPGRFKNILSWAWETAPALTALAEEKESIPNAHMVVHNCSEPQFQGVRNPLLASLGTWCTNTHTYTFKLFIPVIPRAQNCAWCLVCSDYFFRPRVLFSSSNRFLTSNSVFFFFFPYPQKPLSLKIKMRALFKGGGTGL